MDTNIFENDLLRNKPEPETFYNLFTQDMRLTKEDIHKYHYQYSQLSDIDKLEVHNLAILNDKLDLYNKIIRKEEGRRFAVVSSYPSTLPLPVRSTANSAGYDFFAPEDITIPSILLFNPNDKAIIGFGKPTLVKTGVKAYMNKDEVLYLFNRSSNPSKKGLILANGTGVVDSDYVDNPDNEGEIGFLFYNITRHDITIKKGEKIGQGVFQKFLIADGDEAEGDRSGGFGSTGA